MKFKDSLTLETGTLWRVRWRPEDSVNLVAETYVIAPDMNAAAGVLSPDFKDIIAVERVGGTGGVILLLGKASA